MPKALIVTYYWPPAGGPGVQRILKFVKYLPQFGWEPVVLTVRDGEYPARDESWLDDVPDDLKIVTTRSLEPYAVYRRLLRHGTDESIPTFVLTEKKSASVFSRLATFARANLFIPDARIGWKPYAVRAGQRICRDENIDLIFSTAPPMSTHLIAKTLAAETGLPWVADFRDPWTDVFYYHALKRTRLALARDRRLERSVLQQADSIITVSSHLVKLLQSKVDNNYHVIANGFDPDDFKEVEPLPDDGYLHIVHAGHLADTQNPQNLWQALKRWQREYPKQAQKLQLDFYGSIHTDVAGSLEQAGLKHLAVFHGYKPHREIVAAMKRASLLFFVIADCSYAKGILTSKLFDYMGADKPILGIGPVDGDAADILRQTNAGAMVDRQDDDGAFHAIKNMLAGTQTAAADVSAYTRPNLTRQLADIFSKYHIDY